MVGCTTSASQRNNSALSQLQAPVSMAITNAGLRVLLSAEVPTLRLLLMYGNGSSASGPTSLDTGIPFTAGPIALSVMPDGSMVFVPNTANSSVVAYQGIASAQAPALLAPPNTTCSNPVVLPPATRCPSSTPSPSNPVGCILYSFPTVWGSGGNVVSTVSYDTYATMLIVGSTSINSVAVYFVNGTFYKNLTTPPSVVNITQPETSTVDADGYVFVTNLGPRSGSGVLVFSPYPSYAYFGRITNTSDISAAVTSNAYGEFLVLTGAEVDISLVRLTCTGAGVSTQLQYTTPTPISTNDYVYSTQFLPTTGQLSMVYPNDGVIELYTPAYNSTSASLTSVTPIPAPTARCTSPPTRAVWCGRRVGRPSC